MPRTDTDIGLALRRYRMAARLTQTEIARTLGVSQSQVSRWESGQERPRAQSLDMLTGLIWGRNDHVLDALAYQVRESMSPLVLVDARLDILAASRFLRLTGGPLSQFGTILDRRWNPRIDELARQFRMEAAEGAVAVRILVPFTHADVPWICQARLTCCPIGPRLYGMGEMSFVRSKTREQEPPRVVAIHKEQ